MLFSSKQTVIKKWYIFSLNISLLNIIIISNSKYLYFHLSNSNNYINWTANFDCTQYARIE